jgi:hypothetical protein
VSAITDVSVDLVLLLSAKCPLPSPAYLHAPSELWRPKLMDGACFVVRMAMEDTATALVGGVDSKSCFACVGGLPLPVFSNRKSFLQVL